MRDETKQFALLDKGEKKRSVDRFPSIHQDLAIKESLALNPQKFNYSTITGALWGVSKPLFTLPKYHMILAPIVVQVVDTFGSNVQLQIGTSKNPIAIGEEPSLIIPRIVTLFNGGPTTVKGELLYKIVNQDTVITAGLQIKQNDNRSEAGLLWILITYINMAQVPGYRRI